MIKSQRKSMPNVLLSFWQRIDRRLVDRFIQTQIDVIYRSLSCQIDREFELHLQVVAGSKNSCFSLLPLRVTESCHLEVTRLSSISVCITLYSLLTYTSKFTHLRWRVVMFELIYPEIHILINDRQTKYSRWYHCIFSDIWNSTDNLTSDYTLTPT